MLPMFQLKKITTRGKITLIFFVCLAWENSTILIVYTVKASVQRKVTEFSI